ncbi:SEL1-like repeat protein [Gluconacetobacter diazotrophicus]|uniref:SEL1-like repeat protein n=1 Tax=Gluconacetobacter diazotrophicus TaxID=33996 RepID=UPI0002D310DE|nr:tetratricopeptide repeat protein [Gluconacetobacter diazotrophicus]
MISIRRIFDGNTYRSAKKLYKNGKYYLESKDGADPIKAAKLFFLAASKGVAEAHYYLGLCYLEGKGVPRNRTLAIRELTVAAKAGLGEAMVHLSFQYLEGFPSFEGASHFAHLVKDERKCANIFDVKASEYWAKKAIEAGAAEGHVCLGYIYSSVDPDRRNIDLAIEHYETAMQAGNRKAGLGLGQILLQYRSAEAESIRKAEKSLLFAIEEKNPTAAYLLGGLYEVGSGVEKDLSRSRQFYQIAAEGGVVKAMVRLSQLLFDGEGGSPDQIKGETWLRQAAIKGDGAACRLLAGIYSTRARDDEARRWYETGAKLGDPIAAFRLAEAIEKLQGSGAMPVEAMEWYIRALKSGYEPAAIKLCTMLFNKEMREFGNNILMRIEELSNQGNPLAHLVLAAHIRSSPNGDMHHARCLLINASEAGVVTAHSAAGEMIMKGLGGRADIGLAIGFFRKAADAGHLDAMYALATLYKNRRSLYYNHTKAEFWTRRAAAGGHVAANNMLKEFNI